MKRSVLMFAAVATVVMMSGSPAWSQEKASIAGPPHVKALPGTLVVPKSSVPQTPPTGHKFVAHTNLQFVIPGGFTPEEAPPFTGYGYETPASLGCVYGLVATVSGCNPNTTVNVPTGGSQSIAIVDAYDDPDAAGDLAWFSLQFGVPLTVSQFQVVWADSVNSSCYGFGVPVDETGGWELEEALDVEWSHAMAPKANIYLVEACSDFDSDLQQAVLVANNLVQCGKTEINASTGVLGKCPTGSTGKGEVSMSWGGDEFSGENGATSCATLDDSCFTAANVVYVASTGDAPGVIWPGTSKNVVAAGGLTTRRNPSTFNLIGSTGWALGGGGQSSIEGRPSYQSSISSIVGSWRGVPDLSFNADPYTGVWVYDTFPMDEFNFFQWWTVGGTSVAAPSIAGIINRAGAFAASSNAELTTIYANKAVTADFTDITSAYCGPYMGFTAVAGWDFCSGVGADKGYAGK
jgi:kumamolisin